MMALWYRRRRCSQMQANCVLGISMTGRSQRLLEQWRQARNKRARIKVVPSRLGSSALEPPDCFQNDAGAFLLAVLQSV